MKEATIFLTGELNIYTAMEQMEHLVDAVRKESMSILDLSGVTEIDAAGLQILIMAKQEAHKAGNELEMTGHSAPVTNVIELCNLTGLLGDPLLLNDTDNDRFQSGYAP